MPFSYALRENSWVDRCRSQFSAVQVNVICSLDSGARCVPAGDVGGAAADDEFHRPTADRFANAGSLLAARAGAYGCKQGLEALSKFADEARSSDMAASGKEADSRNSRGRDTSPHDPPSMSAQDQRQPETAQDLLRGASFSTAAGSSSAGQPETAQSIFGSSGGVAGADLSQLHPIAKMSSQELDYIALEDDRLNELEGTKGVLPSRGSAPSLCDSYSTSG